MEIRDELAVGGQLLHRFPSPVDVAGDVVEDLRLQDEVTTVDPALGHLRFLVESFDERAVQAELPEPSTWVNCCDGGQPLAASVELDECRQIDVGNTVTVGHHERRVTEVVAHLEQATSSLTVQPRIDDGHLPGLCLGSMMLDRARGEVDRDVVDTLDCLCEVSLDDLALVPGADDELVEAVMAVVLHDVPEDRSVTDLDHRFGPYVGFLAEATADTTRQDDDFHGRIVAPVGGSGSVSSVAAATMSNQDYLGSGRPDRLRSAALDPDRPTKAGKRTMRVLLTGVDGYIGIGLGDLLVRRGHDVVGLDAGFHRTGWLYNAEDHRPATITKDTRDVTPDDLAGFDAVVHLAEVSNDPVGESNRDLTYRVNHAATVRLAQLAKEAGVERFVHMSSCSVYGSTGTAPSREGDPLEPLTAYAECKVLVERDVGALASDDFSPSFLRNATAYGASPRQRFDLVVNDLAASAYLYREIRMASDGTPWRPFVHVSDIAKATACVLDAPRELVHDEIFNVGSDEQNLQVRHVAEIIGDLVPGCALSFGEPSGDRRNYRASFDKINETLPGFSCEWDVVRGTEELLRIFEWIDLDEATYRHRAFTRLKQVNHLLQTGQVDASLRWTKSGLDGQQSDP